MAKPDYKAMYYHLAGRMAGAIEALEVITRQLKQAQQTTEEMFAEAEGAEAENAGAEE